MSRKFGNFTVKEKIAQGAMGEIFLVQDEEGKEFALKTLLPNLVVSDNSESKARFLREISLCENIKHPRIVSINCFDLEANPPYMVMEFLCGGSLEDKLEKNGALDPEEVLNIAIDMCEALGEIEKLEIVHRDIKPANILIDGQGDYKLSDLGLARMSARTQGNENLTMSQTALGTPYYIAPEQALDAKKVDIRSDIYSLGATLYYALTGKRVHEGTSSVHVMMKHLNDEIKDPKEVKEDIPENLTAVIMKMLKKDPKDRYQTPDGLMKDLEKIKDFDAAPEELVASGMKLNKSGASNRTGMVMFSFLFGVIIVAGLAFLRFSCLPPSDTDRFYQKARLELKAVNPEKSREFLNARAENIEKFLIDYPNAKDAERIKKAVSVGRKLASNEVYHLTVKKVGNLKEPRTFSFRIMIDDKKFEFNSEERKKILYPNARIVFKWDLASEIKLQFEEFEWLDDVIYSAKIPDYFTLRSLSGNKIYRVKPEFSDYFTDGEFHIEYELDEISEDDWLAFEEYFYPGSSW